MTEQRNQFAVVVIEDANGLVVPVFQLNNPGSIVISLQPPVGIPLFKRSVAGSPVGACSPVAQQMKRSACKRVIATLRTVNDLIQVNSQLQVLVTVLL